MITAFPRDIRATVGFLLAVVASLSGLPVASAQCGAGWVPGFESGDQGINAEGFVGNAVEALPGGGFVVGGFFVEAGGVPAESIAQWTGQAWKPLGAGLRPDKTSQYAEVIDLAVLPNGDIVAAGLFAFAGDVAARNIARWNGSSWFPLGSGIGGIPRALAVLPNGHLVVAGQILSAGGVPVNNIARWDGASWHATVQEPATDRQAASRPSVDRGRRLSCRPPARQGTLPAARDQPLDCRASQSARHGAVRRRQVMAQLRPGAESLPRRLHRPLRACAAPLRRSRTRTR
jgi:hypothetical protein